MKRVSLKSSCGRMFAHHLLDAGVLQPDGIQHAGGGLVDAVRRVAEPRLAGRALEHDGAGVAVGETLDAGVFLAEARRSRRAARSGRRNRGRRTSGQQRRHPRAGTPAARGDWFERRHGVHYRTRPACSLRASHVPRRPGAARDPAQHRQRDPPVCEQRLPLHLVRPLGFELTRKAVRRAGLDYAELARRARARGLRGLPRGARCGRACSASRPAAAVPTARPRSRPGDALLFGSETAGLPPEVLAQIPRARQLAIPMRAGNRSLNLSNAVALVVYEAWRQNQFAEGDTGARIARVVGQRCGWRRAGILAGY